MPKLKGSVQACKRAGVQAYKRAGVQEFKRVKDKGAIAKLKVDVATDVETQTPFRSETVWALGFAVCFVGLTILCVQQGMSWWLAMLFFAGYFLIAIGIAHSCAVGFARSRFAFLRS